MLTTFCPDPERIAALRSYRVLDTEPEELFDDLTHLAAHITNCPVAAINLIDVGRQWFKSRIGIKVRETPLVNSICAHSVSGEELTIIEDAFADPQFDDNPLVHQDPPLRFYAGALLTDPDGFALGTLCVLDHEPRHLTPDQGQMLVALARQVMSQLTLRRTLIRERAAAEKLRTRERLLSFQYDLTRILAAPTGSETLLKLVAAVCNNLGWNIGCVWLKETPDGPLVFQGAHTERGHDFTPFIRASEEMVFMPGEGFPGMIIREARPITLAELPDTSQFPRLAVARSCKLQAGFGFPVFNDSTVVGSVEFFSVENRELDADSIAALDSFSRQLGQFLERQRIVAELSQNQRLNAAILASALDAIVTIDAESVVLEFNPAAQRLFGYSEAEALGRPMAELIVPHKYREAHNRGMSRYLATGEAHVINRRIEISAINSAGTEFPIELAIVPLGGQTGMIFTAFIRDISAVKALEKNRDEQKRVLEAEVRERTKALTESNAQLESFCYTVAHDLRAPLRSINGFAELLEEDMGKEITVEARDFIQRIKTSARKLDHLIQDLLGYSRLGQIDFPIDRVSLDRVYHAAAEGLEQSFAEANAKVTLATPLGSALGNASALQQVFENLLSNAVKFTPPGEQPELRIWAEQLGATVRIHFHDRGIGIHPHHLKKVFQLFERIATEFPGTGVGLAIVAQAVSRMNGSYGVESEQGKGSDFWIELPVPPQ